MTEKTKGIDPDMNSADNTRTERTPEQVVEEMLEALKEIEAGMAPDAGKAVDVKSKASPEKAAESARVLYQKQGAFYLPDEGAATSMRAIMAGAVALRDETDGQLSVSIEAVEAAKHTTVDTFRTSLAAIIRTWNEERGNQYDMTGSVMYKNFPDSVYGMSHFELRVKQLIGYMADGWQLDSGENLRESILFDGEKQDRGEMQETVRTQQLKAGSDADYCLYIRNLIGGKAPLSPEEKGIVSSALLFHKPEDIIPAKIPQKDNLAFIAGEAMNRGIPADQFPLKNATDAMRLARALNRYDKEAEAKKEADRKKPAWKRIVELENAPREKTSETGYYKLSNREKVFIYSVLEKDQNILANIKGREPQFKALARGLNGIRNAGRRFPSASYALNMVRNNERLPVTRMGEINALRDRGELVRAAELLKTRPGEFARQLDSLLRDAPTTEMRAQVLRSFDEIHDRIPTRTLFTLKEHFLRRQDGEQIKQVPEKGTGYLRQVTVDIPSIDRETLEKTIGSIDQGLQKQLRLREPMGKVYIDPDYKKIPMPKATKGESKTGRPISRGTKIDIPENVRCIRVFKYSEGRSGFMDVSAALYDKHLSYDAKGSVYWKNLKSRYGVHSGDQFTVDQGVSEFIDLDLETLEKDNPEGYVAIQLHAYSSGTLYTGTLLFGFMPREAPSSGEIYEPSKVETAYELSSIASVAMPLLYDITNRQLIWVDRDLKPDNDKTSGKVNHYHSLSIDETAESAGREIYNILHREIPSMYDVLTANARARGVLVDDPGEADIVFGIDRLSDDVRSGYRLEREVEVTLEDGTSATQTVTAEYHDMYDRAVWTSRYL